MSTRARSVPKARRKKKSSKDAPGRYFFGLLTKSLKIKTAEVVAFAREFATLIEAGVPAVPALQLMKEARAGRPFEMVIQGLMDDLNSGRPLADAMGRYPKVFNRFFVRTISTADHGAPILSLDVPSGIDTASGVVYEPAIRAAATLTLALPKEGLRSEQAREMVGELFLADISVPPELYAAPSLGLDVGPIFAKEDVVRVW